MPEVTMPDGTVVQMPDQLTPELGQRLRKFHESMSEKRPPVYAAQGPGNKIVLLKSTDAEGKPITADQASEAYWNTGESLGIYDDPESATKAAQEIQAKLGKPLIQKTTPQKTSEIIPGMKSAAVGREAQQGGLREFGQQLYGGAKRGAREATAGLLTVAGKYSPVGMGMKALTGAEPFTGAAETIMENVKAEQLPEPKTALGKAGAVIGGVLPHMTPLAPGTMAAQMYQSGLEATGGNETAGLAMGAIGAVLGGGAGKVAGELFPSAAKIAAGEATANAATAPIMRQFPGVYSALSNEYGAAIKKPVEKFFKQLVVGGAKTGVDFAAANAANDAIIAAATDQDPKAAALNLDRRLRDLAEGFAFHAVPAVAGGLVKAGKAGVEKLRGTKEVPKVEVPEEPAGPRTRDQILADFEKAADAGDYAKMRSLKAEIDALAPEKPATPFREATPEEAARVGQYDKIKLSPEDEAALTEVMGRKGEVRAGYETEVTPGEEHARQVLAEDQSLPMPKREDVEALLPPETKPGRQEQARADLEAGMYGTDPIEMLQREQEVQQRIQQIEGKAKRLSGNDTNRAYRRYLERNEEYQGLKSELDTLQQNREVSGNWQNTRQAWENLKAELRKNGERGAIGDIESQPDYIAKTAELVKAAIKDGYKNASEWLADMRTKMGDDFPEFYKRIGGVEGAYKLWEQHGTTRGAVDVEAPKFKEWFGKSAAVDETGKPQRFFHGTLDNFEGFNTGKKGAFFATEPEFANFFARGNEGRVMPVYLKMEKPFDFRNPEHLEAAKNAGIEVTDLLKNGEWDALENPEFQKFLKDGGYDSYWVMENGKLNASVMNPEQIKSALTNTGEYSKTSGLIADNLGLQQAYEAGMNKLKDSLGLERVASDGDVVRAVQQKIGDIGKTVKETAIKILDKFKGIGRDLANAIAEELHKVFAGTRESQRGAIGPDINKKPLERAEWEDMIRSMYPGEGNKAKRAEMFAKGMPKAPVEAAEKPKATLKEIASESHVGKVFGDIKRVFAVDVGEKGEQTKASIRPEAARERLENARNWEALKPLRDPFDSMPISKQHELIDAYEAGEQIKGYGGWDKGAEWARKKYDDLWNTMKSEGIDDLGYLENYLTLMVKNKDKVGEYVKQMQKSLAGPANFLKTREIANYKTLREMGIEPEFTNLADIMVVSMANMERLIKAKRILNAEVKSGRVVEVEPGTNPPEGYVQLDTRMTGKIGNRVIKDGGKEGKLLEYWADPGTANVFNNHVSQGFEAIPNLRNVYKWGRTTSDAATALQLAVNGFHFTFAMNDAAISTMSLGLGELQQGNIAKGALDLVKGATPVWAQLDVFMDGKKLQKALLSGEIPDHLKQVAEDFIAAGGTATPADFRINVLHKNAKQQFRQALESIKDKDYWRAMQQATGGMIKGPMQLVEMINTPLMEYMIPRMKLGVWMQLAAHERLKGPESLTERLQKAWRVTEDRLGQMTYDNLFWHQMARQMLHVGTRSVGWNLGTINVGVGGAKDVIKNLASIPKHGLQPMSPRANYIMATMMYSALSGMVTQYLMGQGKPKKLDNPKDEFIPGMPYSTDLFAPRTGGTDRYGRPNRTMTAGYMKDLAEFVRISGGKASFVDFLASKLNPAISGSFEAIRNKDSMGSEIGSIPERIAHAIPSPISFGQVAKEREKGKSWPAALAPVFGFPSAKTDLVSTSGENALRDRINARRGSGEAEAIEDAMKVNRLAEAIHAGREEVAKEAMDRGEISRKQFSRAQKMAREKGFFKTNIQNRNLTFSDMYEIFKEANDEERRMMRGQIAEKFLSEKKKASPDRVNKMAEEKAKMDAWYNRKNK